MRCAYLGAALLAVGCNNPPPSPPSSPAPEPAAPSPTTEPKVMPVAMGFAWPVGRVALVSEKAFKKGNQVELAYELHVCGRKEAGIVVRYQKARYVKVAGRDADDPAVKGALKAGSAYLATLPALVIDADGQLERLDGWEKALEANLAMIPEDQREVMRGVIDNPVVRDAMKGKMGEVWDTWVSTWLAYEPRGPREQPFHYELEDGSSAFEFVIDRTRVEGDRLRLSMTAVQTKEDLSDSMDAMMGAFLSEHDPKVAEAVKNLDLKRTVTREVLIDPHTSVPSEARTETLTEVTAPDQQTKKQVEWKQYRFDWSTKTAADCG